LIAPFGLSSQDLDHTAGPGFAAGPAPQTVTVADLAYSNQGEHDTPRRKWYGDIGMRRIAVPTMRILDRVGDGAMTLRYRFERLGAPCVLRGDPLSLARPSSSPRTASKP
jgi:hypothetical protein